MKLTDLALTADKTLSEELEVGTLTLDPNKSITLSSNRNIILTGKLVSRPIWPAVHTIRFTGIDESKFVGGGMAVLPTDIGLWVMGQGQFDIQGEKKTGHTTATKAIKAGDTVIPVLDATGWRVGDELFITPTLPNVYDSEEAKIKSISGNNITVDKLLGNHPGVAAKSGKIFYAEVANLTRNVRIEGTSSGQSHIFINSSSVQTIKHTAIRFMGPRKDQGGGKEKEFVIGRYGMHFHHCNHINGTIVEGNVIRDTGSHCYVPHGSHGIKFLDNIAYNVMEIAFWSDLGHKNHNTVLERNIAATVKFTPRALNMDLKETDPEMGPTFASSGFLIGMGDGNIFRDNVAVGTQGDPRTGGGFMWETNNVGIPVFENNLAHNCSAGLRIWQNDENNHVILKQTVYNCDIGVYHGAYANAYKYDLCEVINCPFIFHGASVNSGRLRLERSNLDAIIAEGSPLPGKLPILIRDCNYKSFIDQVGEVERGSHNVDIVGCTGPNKVDPNAGAAEVVRVQPKNGQAVRMTKSGTTPIDPFAPTLWGTGDGLKAEYFNDATFTNKVLERIDPTIMFPEMDHLNYYALTGKIVSMRWTGSIQPQFSEDYTFLVASAGKTDLWIGGQKITGKVALIAGNKYPIKIEFSNNDSDLRGGVNFLWKCRSLDIFNPVEGGEYVPQSQMYSNTVIAPPVNQAPKANAGPDQTITTPQSVITLNGSGSDADGFIATYRWALISGAAVSIANFTSAITAVTGLKEGSYTFRLTVGDDKGLTGTDDVVITVKPAIVVDPNKPPVVKASATVTRKGDIKFPIEASDPEGGVLTYLMTQVSGATVTIINPTSTAVRVDNALAGNYLFRLFVTDDKGEKSSVDVPVTI